MSSIFPWLAHGISDLERERRKAAWAVEKGYRVEHYRAEERRLAGLISQGAVIDPAPGADGPRRGDRTHQPG